MPVKIQENSVLADLQLRSPRVKDENSFREAVSEFKQVDPDFSFAFNFDESLCFSNYVDMLERWKKGKDLPENFVPNTFLVGVVGDEIVGRVSIRHRFNNFLERYGGHIGYGVIPSKRNLGYATKMLKLALLEAKALGIGKVLITCDEGNIASMRVIEKNGGVFENVVTGPEVELPKRRYWIIVKEP